jgi:DNA-directed RNA polymerase specialized sigma24 family protein
VGAADLARVEKIARKVERLTLELDQAREELRAAVVTAHGAGESVSEIARRLHVTRARVYQIMEKANGR